VVVVAETITLLICNIFAVSFHLLPLLQHRPAAAVSNIPPYQVSATATTHLPFFYCVLYYRLCLVLCGVRVSLSLSLGCLLQVK
jgi:hypothetical protein